MPPTPHHADTALSQCPHPCCYSLIPPPQVTSWNATLIPSQSCPIPYWPQLFRVSFATGTPADFPGHFSICPFVGFHRSLPGLQCLSTSKSEAAPIPRRRWWCHALWWPLEAHFEGRRLWMAFAGRPRPRQLTDASSLPCRWWRYTHSSAGQTASSLLLAGTRSVYKTFLSSNGSYCPLQVYVFMYQMLWPIAIYNRKSRGCTVAQQ